MEGMHQLLIPHSENPHYTKGDLQILFMDTAIKRRIAKHTLNVTVIAHSTGHGTNEDLDILRNDLENEGFNVTIVQQ
jgi:hypothetical protein